VCGRGGRGRWLGGRGPHRSPHPRRAAAHPGRSREPALRWQRAGCAAASPAAGRYRLRPGEGGGRAATRPGPPAADDLRAPGGDVPELVNLAAPAEASAAEIRGDAAPSPEEIQRRIAARGGLDATPAVDSGLSREDRLRVLGGPGNEPPAERRARLAREQAGEISRGR
jgi:hypothetical protein